MLFSRAQEMPLSEILAIDSTNKMAGESHHWFEIRTANVDFFVGDDSSVGREFEFERNIFDPNLPLLALCSVIADYYFSSKLF